MNAVAAGVKMLAHCSLIVYSAASPHSAKSLWVSLFPLDSMVASAASAEYIAAAARAEGRLPLNSSGLTSDRSSFAIPLSALK